MLPMIKVEQKKSFQKISTDVNLKSGTKDEPSQSWRYTKEGHQRWEKE